MSIWYQIYFVQSVLTALLCMIKTSFFYFDFKIIHGNPLLSGLLLPPQKKKFTTSLEETGASLRLKGRIILYL